MNNTIVNELNVHKTAILSFIAQSNIDKNELKEQFDKSFMAIMNILNKFRDEDSKNALVELMIEIKAELRYKQIKLCQEKSSLLTRYGLENIELFDSDDFKSIVMISELIEICDEKIDSVNDLDDEIVENENTLYIFMDSAVDDIVNNPAEFASDFSDIIERMYSGNYVGKENRIKVIKNSNIENSLEHRGNNGTRLYETQIKTPNVKTNAFIKKIERQLGRQIHFVYKLEVKKCTSANGLTEKREERYKNSKDRIIEILSGMTASEVLKFADHQKEIIDGVLNRKNESSIEEKKYKVIGLFKVNDYLHSDYNLGIFDGQKDENISETEVPEERFFGIECYNIFKRIILYLQTLELEKLQKLDTIFDGVRSDFSASDIPENLPNGQKDVIKENEINRIIFIVIYILKDMTLEELLKIERDITMLMNFEKEYKTYNRNEGIQYGKNN